MRELLSTNGMGLVILGEVLRTIQGVKDALASQDLRWNEGVHAALELQGQIKGMNRIVDILFDIADRTE